jgi:peptide/nickel transport system substrate-binding protein
LIIFCFNFIFISATAQSFDPVKNSDQYILELSYLAYSSLDPATNYESGGSGLNSMICETLYDYDGDSLTDLVPALASAVPVWSDDGLQFNISLKHGVKFHDGVEFNAWVYKYSIDRVMMISDPNSAAFLFASLRGGEKAINYKNMNVSEVKDYLNAGAIKVLNDYEIQFNLDFAYSPLIAAMTYQVGCAVSPLAVIDNIPSTFVADENDNDTGMISLASWFPELAGNYTKLGLNSTHLTGVSGVVPSGIVDEGSPAQHIWFEDHQIGTGPWILKQKTQTVIEMDRNNNWWNKANYPSNAPTKIIIKTVADANIRAQDLINGDADDVFIDVSLVKTFLNSDGTTKKETVKSYKYNTISIDFLGFNLRNGSQLGEGYIEKYKTSSHIWDNNSNLITAGFVGYEHLNETPDVSNPFTVLKFREAIALAFNYTGYIQNVLSGFGKRLEGLIPAGLLGHQDDLIEKGYIPEYNIDAAKALFEELGWKGSITLTYNTGSSARKALASILKNSIEGMNVGINIVVKESFPEFNFIQYYQVPIFTLGWYPDFADPDNYMTPFVHSTKGYYSARIGYFNPEIDLMLANASAEKNPSVRSSLYGDLERYIAEENIFMYTTQLEKVSTMWYQWDGFENSGSRNPMRNFKQVHFMEKVAQAKQSVQFFEEPISSQIFSSSLFFPNTQILSSTTNVFFSFLDYFNVVNIIFVLFVASTTYIAYNLASILKTKKIENIVLKNKSNFKKEIDNPNKKLNYFDSEILTTIETMIDEFSKKES